MPFNIKIETKGLEEAIKYVNSLMTKVDNGVVEGLLISAEEVKERLNLIPEYQGKAEVFVSTPHKIFVGPSMDLVEGIKRTSKLLTYKGRKRCPWWFYATYVIPEERLPIIGTAREEVQRVALEMRDRVREIIYNKILEKIKVGGT